MKWKLDKKVKIPYWSINNKNIINNSLMIACNWEYSPTYEGELKPSIVQVWAHAEDFVSGGKP